MTTNDKYLPGHAAMLAANIIFGINLPISKMLLSTGYMTSYSLNFTRMIGGALLFWFASLFVAREKVPLKDIGKLFLAAFFGIMLNQVTFLKGLSMTAPVEASIIATTVPILTMIIAALYLKEPVTWKKAIGVMIGAAGAITLILNTVNGHREADARLLGNLLCLLSGTSFAFYLVVFRGLIGRYKPVTLMKWMFLFAAIGTTPLTWHDFRTMDFSLFTWDTTAEVIFVVVGATFLAYLLIPIGQRILRPTVVSMYNYLQPLVASLLAIAVGLDVFTWDKAVAGVLVFTGVYVVTVSKSRAQVEEQMNHALHATQHVVQHMISGVHHLHRPRKPSAPKTDPPTDPQ